MDGLDEKTRKIILASQRNEATENLIYRKLTGSIKDEGNKKILEEIAANSLRCPRPAEGLGAHGALQD